MMVPLRWHTDLTCCCPSVLPPVPQDTQHMVSAMKAAGKEMKTFMKARRSGGSCRTWFWLGPACSLPTALLLPLVVAPCAAAVRCPRCIRPASGLVGHPRAPC